MKKITSIFITLACVLLLSSCKTNLIDIPVDIPSEDTSTETSVQSSESQNSESQNSEELYVPTESNETYSIVNNNKPTFTKDEITTVSFEHYSDLDELGRCGPATACIGKDLMPTEKRGSIGMVKPSGWHTIKYDFIDGKYLYNRCHLIGYQLSGENANEKNLITGTRYFNTIGMLPFENEVADYVKETGNHVMYRVVPSFIDDNLVATGVSMEAYSVEDNGRGVCYNVFVRNIQPGVIINYATGTAMIDENGISKVIPEDKQKTFVINTNSKNFHKPNCQSVKSMLDKNKKEYTGTAQALIEQGYTPCQMCHPDE